MSPAAPETHVSQVIFNLQMLAREIQHLRDLIARPGGGTNCAKPCIAFYAPPSIAPRHRRPAACRVRSRIRPPPANRMNIQAREIDLTRPPADARLNLDSTLLGRRCARILR
jgi:hypothetical protein